MLGVLWLVLGMGLQYMVVNGEVVLFVYFVYLKDSIVLKFCNFVCISIGGAEVFVLLCKRIYF